MPRDFLWGSLTGANDYPATLDVYIYICDAFFCFYVSQLTRTSPTIFFYAQLNLLCPSDCTRRVLVSLRTSFTRRILPREQKKYRRSVLFVLPFLYTFSSVIDRSLLVPEDWTSHTRG